jgi:hypothetical protein
LDLEVFCRGALGWDQCVGGHCADGAVFGFLLDLLYQGYEGEEVCAAGIGGTGMLLKVAERSYHEVVMIGLEIAFWEDAVMSMGGVRKVGLRSDGSDSSCRLYSMKSIELLKGASDLQCLNSDN